MNLLVYDVRSRQSRSVRRGATLPFEYWLEPRDALVFERAGAVWIADFEVGTERVLLAPACSGLGIFGRDLIRYERPRAGLPSSEGCAHYNQREDVFVDLRSGIQITPQQAERLMEDRAAVLPVVLRRFTRKDCAGVVVVPQPHHEGVCYPDARDGRWRTGGLDVALVRVSPHPGWPDYIEVRVSLRRWDTATERVVLPVFLTDSCVSLPAALSWSADGRYLLVQQDERRCGGLDWPARPLTLLN